MGQYFGPCSKPSYELELRAFSRASTARIVNSGKFMIQDNSLGTVEAVAFRGA